MSRKPAWEIFEQRGRFELREGETTIFDLRHNGSNMEHGQERLRLAAAAPEMFEALKSIFLAGLCPEPKTLKGWVQRHDNIDRIARAAFFKAEGRDNGA